LTVKSFFHKPVPFSGVGGGGIGGKYFKKKP
jgi:hypothetical protein